MKEKASKYFRNEGKPAKSKEYQKKEDIASFSQK